MRLRAFLLLVAASSIAAAPARAQQLCAPDPSLSGPAGADALGQPVSALGLVDPNARFQYIRALLDEDARHARVWTAAWAVAGGVFIAGNAGYAALTTDPAMRVDAIIEAVKSVFIPAVLVLQPVRAMRDATLVDGVGAAFELSPGRVSSCVPLARAEELLVDAAEDEALATGWVAHIVVIGGNVAISAVQAFGLGHWAGAGLGLVGIGVGEVQILTHPTGALDALEPYSKGHLGRGVSPLAWSIAPFVAPPLMGIAPPAPAWGASARVDY